MGRTRRSPFSKRMERSAVAGAQAGAVKGAYTVAFGLALVFVLWVGNALRNSTGI